MLGIAMPAPRVSPSSGPLLAVTLALLCGGCTKTKDVTSDPTYGSFSCVVGTWKAKSQMRVVEISNELFLVARSERYPGERDVATVPADTGVKIECLILESTVGADLLHPMGSLTSGPYSGKRIQLDWGLFGPNRPDSWSRTTAKKWTVAADKLEK